MKSLFRIIRRYSLTVGVIILIILVCNGCLLLGIGYYAAGQEGMERYAKISLGKMEQIGDEFQNLEENYILSERGTQILENSEFVWMMALNQEGTSVWEWRLPQEIPRQYGIQEVASFSRWYLADYPVKILASGELLLVFGCDPEMISRHNVLISTALVKNAGVYMRVVIVINLLVILIFILCFGYQFYGSMKPIVQGIEDLAAGRLVRLKAKGTIGDLAVKLNETSELLLTQNQALARRDLARTEWIAGVSHDIRTPLSLIVGHSDRLSKDESLSRENRMLAENIRRQSLIIRQLIADLNLTSKLAYQAQPLKKSRCQLASLVRSCVSDVYNEGLEMEAGAEYEFEIVMKDEMEKIQVEADEGLLMRALRNLLGNSVRHNPKGCQVTVTLAEQERVFSCLVQDTGPGIPKEIVLNMENPDSSVHIMGLRLADQIAKAHGGGLVFERRMEGGYDAGIRIGKTP